jgi:CBS-domain-containing membrane protein
MSVLPERRPDAGHERIPPWAWIVAGLLVLASGAILVVGRGGNAVLAGVAAAFGALAVLLLSVPDGDPAAEAERELPGNDPVP